MKFLYDLGIRLYALGIYLAAISGNSKAKFWITGRKSWRGDLRAIKESCSKPVVWIHAASLGEYEMAVPVIEKLQDRFDIVVSVFSPSAYEVLKNRNIKLVYLPLSTTENARDFVGMLAPEKVVFVKYDLWFHFVKAINAMSIPFYLICASFKNNQWFFSFWGKFLKSELLKIDRIFTLNESSSQILNEQEFTNYSFAGDTRCDRVIKNSEFVFEDKVIEQFADNKKILVCGSTWSQDESVILESLPALIRMGFKVILAPHEISMDHLGKLRNDFSAVFHSEALVDPEVMIIDSVGILKYVYRYAEIAYVGGAFRQGLHNILEPAAYGIPVVFGPEVKRYPEAEDMIKNSGGFSIANAEAFIRVVERLSDQLVYDGSSEATRSYVEANAGASAVIVAEILGK